MVVDVIQRDDGERPPPPTDEGRAAHLFLLETLSGADVVGRLRVELVTAHLAPRAMSMLNRPDGTLVAALEFTGLSEEAAKLLERELATLPTVKRVSHQLIERAKPNGRPRDPATKDKALA